LFCYYFVKFYKNIVHDPDEYRVLHFMYAFCFAVLVDSVTAFTVFGVLSFWIFFGLLFTNYRQKRNAC